MNISFDCTSEVTEGLDEEIRTIKAVCDLDVEGPDIRIERADEISVKDNVLTLKCKFTRCDETSGLLWRP